MSTRVDHGGRRTRPLPKRHPRTSPAARSAWVTGSGSSQISWRRSGSRACSERRQDRRPDNIPRRPA
jgi:hypothetical protein